MEKQLNKVKKLSENNLLVKMVRHDFFHERVTERLSKKDLLASISLSGGYLSCELRAELGIELGSNISLGYICIE